ncbi:MAG: SDR family NAD(P)-dependent oxidoreductase [Acidimicrobiales bacterium]
MDPDRPPGRAAIVSGGAGGLGAATVRRLARRGLGVVVFDRDADGATAVAQDLAGRGVEVAGDATADHDVARAIEAASSLGVLSVLVNLAGGIAGGGATVGRDGTPHAKEPFVRTIERNVTSTFNVIRLVASSMAANPPDENGERGVIVNRRRSPVWKASVDRWPTPRRRRRSSA